MFRRAILRLAALLLCSGIAHAQITIEIDGADKALAENIRNHIGEVSEVEQQRPRLLRKKLDNSVRDATHALGFYEATYTYALDGDLLNEAAALIKEYRDFSAFSKRNTQVKSFTCEIMESGWSLDGGTWKYRVRANRFLRGMVRGLVGTMLKVGRGKNSIDEFRKIIESGDAARADFSVPGRGLFLVRVEYPVGILG